jgi:hypothetical protein
MNHPMVEQQFQYTEPQICKAPLVHMNIYICIYIYYLYLSLPCDNQHISIAYDTVQAKELHIVPTSMHLRGLAATEGPGECR